MEKNATLEQINHPLFQLHNIKVSIKRDDLIHPIISGNKWRKLKANIGFVKAYHKRGIVSFGGSYSNHIHALAYACYLQGIDAHLIIRGEPENADNFTLSWAKHWRATLHFVDRKTYRQRQEVNYLSGLAQQFPEHHIIPEGGSNVLALQGVGEVITELNQQIEFDTLMLPVGSGGTIAGLINADKNQHTLLGVAVLKNADYLRNDIINLLPQESKTSEKWQLLTEFHRGGYARFSATDSQRIIEFIKTTGIPFEPVYSGKMLLAFLDLLEQGYFKGNQHIVLLHTGGLQGLGGLAERKIIVPEQWHLPSGPPAR